MRISLIVLVTAVALLGAGPAQGAGGTNFAIVGGTVTLRVDARLVAALAADGASIAAASGATATVTKTKELLLHFPVVADSRAIMELAKHCRCVQVPTRGAIVFRGPAATATWARPVLNLDGLRGGHRIGATYQGLSTTVTTLSGVSLPRSIPGRVFARSGMVAKVYTTGLPALTAVAPSLDTGVDWTLGRVEFTLKLKARS